MKTIRRSVATGVATSTILLGGAAHADLTVGTSIQFNDNDGANIRTVSVYPGNSFVTGWAFDGTTERTIDLGTVLEYNFFNEDGASNVIGSYAGSGSRISVATTTDTGIANNKLIAEAVYTTSDPTGGTPDFAANTHVNGLGGDTTGTIDVTGLADGTIFFIYGSNGADGRGISFTVTQGASSVTFAESGSGFWENGDTISAVTPVSFTNTGTDNTISYSLGQTTAGKFMGVVLSELSAGDTTAPFLGSGYPLADTATLDGFTVRAKINEDGTAYYVVLAGGATTPSAAEVKAGTGIGGATALASGSILLTANTEGTADVAGLADSTPYDVWVVAEDGVPNLQADPSLAEVTTLAPDLADPVWETGFPTADSVSLDGFTVRAAIDEDGTAYYVVLDNGATAPSAAEVKAGTGSGGAAALASDSITLTALDEGTANVTGLPDSTEYDVYVVAEDLLSNLQDTPVLADVATLVPDETAPEWTATYPQVDTPIYATALAVRASINENGTAYYVILPGGATEPTPAEVAAGTGAIASGAVSLTAGVEGSILVQGLAPGTTYDVYFIAEDDADAATAVPNLQDAVSGVLGVTTAALGSTLTPGTDISFGDNGSRTLSVHPGAAEINAFEFDGVTPVTISLGTSVTDYNFFRENEANDNTIASYASGGSRISVPTTTDTGIGNIGAISGGIWTTTDPADYSGTPDISSPVSVNAHDGILTGTVDVSGLSSGTLYIIYGSYNLRAASLSASLGSAITEPFGGTFEYAGDTEYKVAQLSFTNAGDSTLTYEVAHSSSGKFIGVVLSDTVSGAGGPVITAVTVSGNDLILDFTGIDGTTYKVTESADLSTAFGDTIPLVTGTTTGGIGQIIYPGGATAARNFVRLEEN